MTALTRRIERLERHAAGAVACRDPFHQRRFAIDDYTDSAIHAAILRGTHFDYETGQIPSPLVCPTCGAPADIVDIVWTVGL